MHIADFSIEFDRVFLGDSFDGIEGFELPGGNGGESGRAWVSFVAEEADAREVKDYLIVVVEKDGTELVVWPIVWSYVK